VLLWSSGFIVAKFGLPYAPPLTFLLLRFLGVLVLLVPAVLLLKAPGRVARLAISPLPGCWCRPVI
jgi:drug/metabolite transporter (DMT)-like permease